MTTFRSEMQVPINKGNTEVRDSIDLNPTSNLSKFSNSSIDQWCDKFIHKFKSDHLSCNDFSDDNLSKEFPENHNANWGNIDLISLNSEKAFRQLQSQIAKGNDGNMHFTAKFDIKDITNPDKIKVFVKDETSLIMNIEIKEAISSKSSKTQEFTRNFNLPPNIISESITCTISTDNILILDGILDSSFDQRKYSSSSLSNSLPYRRQSLASSSSSSSLIHSPSYNDRYKISVHIGNHYNPQDISIKTRDDKIFINARHEEKSDSRTNYREFSKEIQIPDRVDPISLSCIFNNGNLSIEAPFNN